MCPGLVGVLSRPALNELYLIGVSYVIMATFLTLELSLSVSLSPVWATMFFIYFTYALLPIRLQEAVLAGVTLSLAHLVCTLYLADPAKPVRGKEVSHYIIVRFVTSDVAIKLCKKTFRTGIYQYKT